MILENDGTKARPVRVFESVLGIVDRGRDHLRVWEATRGIIESDTWLADLAMPFFVLTAIAHVEAAAMYAAKLADTYGDSVNVGYLLNIIEADKKRALRSNEWPRVEGPVAAARNRLGEISENTRRIKEKRDHDLAHLDRRHLSIAFESQAIEVDDLRKVFDAVDEIARTLAANASVFANVDRYSLGFGSPASEWIADLVYFARAGFCTESIPSPNGRSERIRQWDRLLRAARVTPDGR